MKQRRLLVTARFACLLLFLILSACSAPESPTLTPAPTETSAPSATPAPPTAAATATPPPTNTPIPTPTLTPTPALLLDPSAYAFRRIATGLVEPVFLADPGDGSGRLFVVEQGGLIRILHPESGQVLPDPFLNIIELVNDAGNEQGLLGLAFSPRYAEDGWFFVNYTDVNGDTQVVRYTVSAGDPDRADPGSALVILQIDQPYANHNGGHLIFGRDGYLYIGMGDGGSGGDPHGNGQRLDTLLGKMLRVDVSVESYAIPPDNPFVGRSDARPEIWAYGLRNPWRYSFDRATGDLYIGDVGQGAYEEVSLQPGDSRGGENYGWNFMEGSHPYEGVAPEGLIPPITDYHQSEGGCSVVGGYVYRGPSLPGLSGIYLFGDYCSGLIWALYRDEAGAWQRMTLFDTDFTLSSFAEDEVGELYVLNHRAGEVYQLVAAP